jgi:uncharacterized protein involved in exopolysaccharide biosynthesis
VAAIVGLDRIRGPQYQSTLYFLVGSRYALQPRDYTAESGNTLSPIAEDSIPAAFDFSNVANSLQVAGKTITDLNLPVKSAQYLFKPDLLDLRPPTVQVTPGQPSGDAANKGLLTELLGVSSGDKDKTLATSRWVELVSTAYDEQQAQNVARTYAENALAFYRQAQANDAANSQQQMLAHVQQAQNDLDAADAAVAKFEMDNHLLDGGAEFQSAQSVLDTLRQQRTDLVSSIGGQKTTNQRLDELNQEISRLQDQTNQLTQRAGDAQTQSDAAQSAATAKLAAAQSAYTQAVTNYSAAAKEVELARSQGFPAAKRTVQKTDNGPSDVSTTTTEIQGGGATTETKDQLGYTQTEVQDQSGSTTTTKQTQKGYTTSQVQDSPRSTISASTSNPGSTIKTSTTTSTTGSASNTTASGSANGGSSSSGSTTANSTVTNPAVTTTTTTTNPEVKVTTTGTLPDVTTSIATDNPDVKTTSTITSPNIRTTSITTSPAQTNETTTSTTNGPSSNSVVTDAPNDIRSEAQAATYLVGLSRGVDARAADVLDAEVQLADAAGNNAAVALNNQLAVNRDQLTSLRSAQSSLMRADTDPAQGLKALDDLIANKEQRIAFLDQIAPQYRRLTQAADTAKTQHDQMVRLAQQYNRLALDATADGGVQLIDQPYTMQLPSRLSITLGFGVLISLLLGISLAFCVAYFNLLRRGGTGSTPALTAGDQPHSSPALRSADQPSMAALAATHYELGRLLAINGSVDDARAHFDEALRLQSSVLTHSSNGQLATADISAEPPA